jgi:hypothetical protein
MRITTWILMMGAFVALVTASLWFLQKCEEPRVHYAKQLEVDVGGYYVDYPRDSTWVAHTKREVFIIENAPKDRKHLIKIIQENEKFAPLDGFQIESTYDQFYREYYRESCKTPLDYKEKKSKFGFSDELHEHDDDRICSIIMIKRRNMPDSLKHRWTCSCPELEDILRSRHR